MSAVLFILGWIAATGYTIGIYQSMAQVLGKPIPKGMRVALAATWSFFLPHALGMLRGKS